MIQQPPCRGNAAEEGKMDKIFTTPSRGKTTQGLPALLLHPGARGTTVSSSSCSAEIVHFLPLHMPRGCVCCKDTGFLKVECEKGKGKGKGGRREKRGGPLCFAVPMAGFT